MIAVVVTPGWRDRRAACSRIYGSTLENELKALRPSTIPGEYFDARARVERRHGRFDRANLSAELAHAARCGRKFIPTDQARGFPLD